MTELGEVVRSDPGGVDRYFDVLADRTEAPDEGLPNTGVPYELERALSARFVAHTVHGTRAGTVLLVRENGTFEMVERSFGVLGQDLGEVVVRGVLDLTN